MVDKTLSDEQTGNFDTLKTNAVDPSDIETDKDSPRYGKPRFLVWELVNNETGLYWEAVGKDGTVYTVKKEEPVVQGKVTIT